MAHDLARCCCSRPAFTSFYHPSLVVHVISTGLKGRNSSTKTDLNSLSGSACSWDKPWRHVCASRGHVSRQLRERRVISCRDWLASSTRSDRPSSSTLCLFTVLVPSLIVLSLSRRTQMVRVTPLVSLCASRACTGTYETGGTSLCLA